MNLIEFKNVNFSYAIDDDDENQVTVDVLKNFNLTIEKGSFVAILGHNGSGKSTTAKLINGINIAQSGEVIVDGQKVVDDETIFDIRRKVGMVFQNPDNQIVSSIVEEDVAFGVENLGVEPEEKGLITPLKRWVCMNIALKRRISFPEVKNSVLPLQA